MTKPNLLQLRNLVGNPDAYSLQQEDGKWFPKREPLTDAVLRDHLALKHTVGTYIGHKFLGPFGKANEFVTMSRTLVFDLDTGEDAEYEAELVEAALQGLGFFFTNVGLEFSGRKGYHVWLPLARYRPNYELRRIGRAVLALAGIECEVFPKQDEVKDLGNLVKLPGGIHQVSKQRNDFLGTPPTPVSVAKWEQVLASLPAEQRARRTGPVDSRFPCLSSIQNGISEGGRNIQLFHFATMFRRHGADDELLDSMLRYVNEKCDPPMDDAAIEEILTNSRASGPICEQLPDGMRESCGEYCIKQRLSGLHTLPGQLRNASEGEHVVLTVTSHAGTAIALTHEDLDSPAKGRVRVTTKEPDNHGD